MVIIYNECVMYLLLQVWSEVVSRWTSDAGRIQLLDVECGPLDR